MNGLNVAHLHLLLNHFPTIGTIFGIGLLLLAMVRRNEHLLRASLEVFFVVALLTLPAYLSGGAAESAISGRADVSPAAIDAHRDAALLALVLMQVSAFLAWLGLWRLRRASKPQPWAAPSVLLSACLTIAATAHAATVGGEIRHPEIRVDETAVAARGWLNTERVETFVRDTPWAWPAAETLHFLGLSLLFGILLTVNLRIVGALKSIPFAGVHRLLPWSVLAYGIMLATGLVFFTAAAEQYVDNVAFHWKIALLVPAGANILYLTVVDRAWALGPGDEAPALDRAIAASSIGLWIGVMYFGRMLPFIGDAF